MLAARDNAQLLIIDVQERLAPAMQDTDSIVAQCAKLASAACHANIPITATEQYPKGIGSTVKTLRDAAGSRAAYLPKMTFSCVRDDAIVGRIDDLAATGRRQIFICGMESHVCVLQSAIELKLRGYDVFAVADAMSSRKAQSKEIALQRMQQAGIILTTFEMVVFEWLERAGTDEFKAMMQLIK